MRHADPTHLGTFLHLQYSLLTTTQLASSSPRYRFLVSDAPRTDPSHRGSLDGRVQDAEHSDTPREERPTPLSRRRPAALDAVHPTPPSEPTHCLYRVQHGGGHQRRRCRRRPGDIFPFRRIVVRTRKRTRPTMYVVFDGTDSSQKLTRST